MTGTIIDLVARLVKRGQRIAACKIAKGLCGERLFHVGMKVPRQMGETVELRILSNEAGRKVRNLARITVQVDELRRLMRELDEEPPSWPQRSPQDQGS